MAVGFVGSGFAEDFVSPVEVDAAEQDVQWVEEEEADEPAVGGVPGAVGADVLAVEVEGDDGGADADEEGEGGEAGEGAVCGSGDEGGEGGNRECGGVMTP